MDSITILSQPAKNSNRIKDLIIDILSNEFPLTAKKIHKAITKKHAVPVAYQNVHKFAKELVEQGVLKEIDREYLINTEWVDQIQEFGERIKRVYFNKPSFTKTIETRDLPPQNTYGIIQAYKKRLSEVLEAELSNKPCLNAVPIALAESGVRITGGRETNIMAVLQQQCSLILGDSGSGKTTALKMMALYQIKQGNHIPVFLKLNNYQGENLLDIATKQIALMTGQQIGKDIVRSFLHEGSFLFLLDGLNEVSNEIRIRNTKYDGYEMLLSNLIRIFSDEKLSRNKIILSCRAYNDPKERLPIPAFRLQPLTESMIEIYLSHKKASHLFAQMKKDRKIFSLCQNPLMFSMLIKIFEGGKLKSIKRGEIYKYFIDEFLYGWESKTIKTKKEIIVNDMIKLLSGLAYEMAFLGIAMDYSKAHRIMEKEAKKMGLTKGYMNDLLHYILSTNLLIKVNNNCEFMHQSVQEYLAATELKERISRLSAAELENIILDKQWHEIIVFYSALEEDTTPIVEKIYRLFKQTKKHSLLFLAAKCIRERNNVSDEMFESILDSLLQIYHYPDEEFYSYWYQLNNVFQSWESKRVTCRIIEFFSSCEDKISPRVVNVLHHSSSAMHSEHEGIRRLQDVISRKSRNRHLIYSAVEILGLFKNTAIIPGLVKFLSDKDPILKAQSAWALKKIGSQALDAVRKRSKDPVRFLNKIQQSTFPALVKLLDNKNQDFVRGHAIIELCKMNYKKAMPYILECLKDDKPIIRYHATYMIPNMDDEDASFLLNFMHVNEDVPEDYKRIISSIGKKKRRFAQ